jgi:hypothetical protein
MYFQNKGLYRETGGANQLLIYLLVTTHTLGHMMVGSNILISFKELIPNFVPVTVSSDTKTTKTLGLFINNDLGTYNENINWYSNKYCLYKWCRW